MIYSALISLTRTFSITLVLWSFCPISAQAATIFVDKNVGGGANDGTSWANAFTELSAAIPAAATLDEIWVADGTYKPTATTDRRIYFAINITLSLYGGFQGNNRPGGPETLRDQRNPDPNTNGTILSAEIGNQNDVTDNSNHVFSVGTPNVNTLISVVIDGFTIRDGYGDDISFEHEAGGAMFCWENVYSLIENCIFIDNESAAIGGAFYSRGGNAGPGHIFNDCDFVENISANGGGAIFFDGGEGPPTLLTRCRFIDNETGSEGGAVYIDQFEHVFTECSFLGNIAAFNGGAVANYGISEMRGCEFIGNQANPTGVAFQEGYGGAIFYANEGLTVVGCLFEQNAAHLEGGAVKADPGASLNPPPFQDFYNSRFNGNTAQGGGAISVNSPVSTKIIGCSFSGNVASGTTSVQFSHEPGGGAIFNYSKAINISHSTFVKNTAEVPGAALLSGAGAEPSAVTASVIWKNSVGGDESFASQVRVVDTGTVSYSNSLVQNILPLTNGNFSADPQFVRLPDDGGDGFGDGNDNYGNLLLLPTSPALDRLNPAILPLDVADVDNDSVTNEALPLDVNGFARVTDIPGHGNGGTLDLGAHELPGGNIRYYGEELEPPGGVDDPTVIAPQLDQPNVAFVHPFDGKVIGNSVGLVNVSWGVGGFPGATTVQFLVLEATPTTSMYRTDLPNNGPLVDLTSIIDGEPPGAVIVHHNNIVLPDPDPGNPLVTADAFVDQTKRLNAKKAGVVLIEYRNATTQESMGFEVVQIRNRAPVLVSNVPVGSEVHPADPNNQSATCQPILTVSTDPFGYQHLLAGPSKGKIFSIRPNTDPKNFEVYWFRQGLFDICWPSELTRYTAVWPNDPQINLQSQDPKVALGAHQISEIKYKEPLNHASIVNNEYVTTGPGMATLFYQNDVPTGNVVSFEVVKTVDSRDAGEGLPILATAEIGDRIVDAGHDLSCFSSGYIKQGTNYDPSIYAYPAAGSVIIPVNEGELEVWFYETSQKVCWPFKSVLYNCVWPGAPDHCLIIANQKGAGPFNQANRLNPSIYFRGTVDSPTDEIGYNPNEEHAQWETTPGSSVYAARVDINSASGKSKPFVLVKYQDALAPGKPWDMDVIQVREIDAAGAPPGCPCTQEPCTFNYSATAGTALQLPLPLGFPVNSPPCPESFLGGEENRWDDQRGNQWFRRGNTFTNGFFYERWDGICTPWRGVRQDGLPLRVQYYVEWPKFAQSSLPPGGGGVPIKDVFIDLSFGETIIRDLSKGVRQAEILYNEANAVLIRPWKPSFVPLAELPPDYLTFRGMLPPHIQARLDYDIVNQLLIFNGLADQGLVGIMSVQERDTLKDIFSQSHHADFRTAVDALYMASQQSGASAVGTIVGPNNPDWGIALSAGKSNMTGWVVLGYNGDLTISEPSDVEVFNVGCPPDAGSLLVVEPECIFDEQLTVRWSGDCGGDCMDLEFKWEFAVGENPSDYEDINPNANPNDPPAFNPWNDWVHDDGSSGWVKAKNEIVIGGQSANPLFVLTDNWFRLKVRIPADAQPGQFPCPAATESEYTDHQLTEGWIKRVKRALNPFDQRVRSFTQSRVATYVSMIEQLGTPYVDRVGLTCDANILNSLGLIELYQGVLLRGRSFTIDQGIDYGPANQALILMAGALADFYMLLGNEAYGDALDPTLILTPDLQSQSTSIFSFQDQLPTNQNSLLYEELTLLRGRDNRGGTPIDRFPVFNKLFWNFTSGDGQVAYVNNYNIKDVFPRNSDGSRGDGFINEDDARTMFPQGHGDAYGHYLTALRFYYELLRHDSFTWETRSEAVLVDQVPVQVNYAHERKMARAAAARAKCGASILDLTYREMYTEDPSQQTQGYPDTVPDRHWGLTDWGRRTFIGAYFDWATSNANIPAIDDDPSRIGTVRQVDRTTVPDLAEIVAQAQTIQNTVDQADAGLNPLGLARNVVPFDLQPFDEVGRTHFEQIFDRALPAVVNAVQIFRFASQASHSLRENQDETQDFENNIEDQEFAFDSRLVEVFGTPYPEDVNPLTGNTYGPSFTGPDLFHWMYIDKGDIAGFDLPSANQTINVGYSIPSINDQGVVTTPTSTTMVKFNVVPGFGIVKPKEFTLERRVPGEIQLALSDLIQANFAFKQGINEYGTAISNIEDFVTTLNTIKGLKADQINIRYANIGATTVLNTLIIVARGLQVSFAGAAKQAEIIGETAITSLPEIVGLSNDVTSPLRGALFAGTSAVKSALETLSEAQEAIQVGIEQAKELADKGTEIDLEIKENQIDLQERLLELRQMVRDLKAKEIELYSLQESVRQASMRYLVAINQGLRLLQEREAFRQTTAEAVSGARYRDMAFRIFRNDALQKYRAQFDLAAKFVYLTAKAYGYETNLLEFSPLSGEGLLERITKQRTIGEFDDSAATAGGLPFRAGAGLSGIMAELDSNFRALKPVLGFNNPTLSTDKFSLRSDYKQILPGATGEAVWKEYLRLNTVEDLRTEIPEFNQYLTSFDPYRSFNPTAAPGASGEPGIVIEFPTTIQADLNFFNIPPSLGGGDSFFPSDHFSIKIKQLGVWFSEYSPANGLTSTPRCYLIPVGIDQIRIPGAQNLGSVRKIREWRVVDSIIPPPFDLGESVFGQRLNGWLPSQQLPGVLLEPRLRRHASIRAFADDGVELSDIDESQFVTTSSLVGRSVWNSKWLLIIPGRFLQQADPKLGIDRFIDTVSDIRLAFETFQFSGSKSKESIQLGLAPQESEGEVK